MIKQILVLTVVDNIWAGDRVVVQSAALADIIFVKKRLALPTRSTQRCALPVDQIWSRCDEYWSMASFLFELP